MVILYKPWDIVTFSLHIYSDFDYFSMCFTKAPLHLDSLKLCNVKFWVAAFLSGNLTFFSLPSCPPWPAPGVGCGEIFMLLRL